MRSPAVATPGADLAPRAPALPRPVVAALFATGVLAAALAIPAFVAAGMGLALDGRVMPRVSVAGVDVGFLTAAEAEVRLHAGLADLTTGDLHITLDGTSSAVSFESLGVTRAWKGHDWDALNRLHEHGLIANPKGKAKSVVLTNEGKLKAKRACEKLFGTTV